MKKRGFVPNPALVSFLGLAPLVGATTSFASGCVVGLLMALGMLGMALFISLTRNRLRGRIALVARLAFAAIYASLAWLLVEAWSPTLSADIGIYLPLLAVNSLLMHEMRKNRKSQEASLGDSLMTALLYFLVAAFLAAIREIGGSGILTLPIPSPTMQSLILIPTAPLPILLTPAGGFLLLALLAIADRLVSPVSNMKEMPR